MDMTPQATAGQASAPVPRTEGELREVYVRREELRSQLQSTSSTIDRLIVQQSQAAGTGDRAAAQEISTRIAEHRARFARIEGQLATADDQVSQALAAGVGSTIAQAPPPPVEGVAVPGVSSQQLLTEEVTQAMRGDRVEYERALLAGGAGLLLAGVLLWRWAWRRAAARLRRELAATLPSGHRELRDAVDAIAIEVERISENQRFVTKLLGERQIVDPVPRVEERPR